MAELGNSEIGQYLELQTQWSKLLKQETKLTVYSGSGPVAPDPLILLVSDQTLSLSDWPVLCPEFREWMRDLSLKYNFIYVKLSNW